MSVSPLRAYHGDLSIKTALLTHIDRHIAADHLVRGTGWNPNTQKGCAIGCSLETYDHALYPVRFGIPEWLARVEDVLFECMSFENSRTWPRDFADAIPVGVDLDRIKGPFLIFVLHSTLDTFDVVKFPDVARVIECVIALWRRSDAKSMVARAEWAATKMEAWAAETGARAAGARAADAWAEEARAAGARAADAWAADAWAEEARAVEAGARAAEVGAAEVGAADAWAAGAWAAGATARAVEAGARAAGAEAKAKAKCYDFFADRLLSLLRETSHAVA